MENVHLQGRYIHGYSVAEQRRLYRQAEVLAPVVFEGLDLSGGQTLLEIGCGVGAQTKNILQRWPHLKIVSVDRNEAHLAVAKSCLHDEITAGRVSLHRADAKKLPFPNGCFDIALTIWVLEHVNDPEEILAEAKRVLKPGGRLILIEVDNSTLSFSPRNDIIQDWWKKFNAYQESGGGDPFIGRRLGELLPELGFQQVVPRELALASSRGAPSRRLCQIRWLRDLLLSGSEGLKNAGYVTEAYEQRVREEFLCLESNSEIHFSYLALRFEATKPISCYSADLLREHKSKINGDSTTCSYFRHRRI